MSTKPHRKLRSIDDLLGELPDTPPDLVTESELAAFWSVTDRQVRTLVHEGAIRKFDSRHFDKEAATRGYIRRLIEQANRKTDPELRAEKLRLAKEQADKLEIANAESRSELVSAKEVEREWAGILRDVRAALLSVPARVGSRLPTLSAFDLKQIDSEIRAALNALSESSSPEDRNDKT